MNSMEYIRLDFDIVLYDKLEHFLCFFRRADKRTSHPYITEYIFAERDGNLWGLDMMHG